ncbi:MAG: hypothetical protein JNK48_06065 [Bryobacterales bacterium]|nr:hypothetical protein [Bryobacterales bacterium]
MFLNRAGRWFLESGIQEEHGGVARYYRIDLARNNRISTEITGYAVSALAYLHQLTGEQQYLDAAVRAGRFLTDAAWDAERQVFPFEWPPTSAAEENRVFFFDGGIIIRGLLALFRATKDERYLQRAIEAGDGMARAHEHCGNYAPILQLPSLEALAFGGTWSNNPGCYQLKSALAWRQLWEQTKEPRFEALFETALQRALASDATFLPGTGERQRVMDRLHAYSYFLEALLSVADRAECRRALSEGIGKVAFYLRDIAPEFARSDVYGQLLRVRLFANAQGAAPLDEVQAAEEAAAMETFQMQALDRRLDGGFCFGKRDGYFTPHANPVSTAFCLQALAMWRQHRSGAIRESWRDLI